MDINDYGQGLVGPHPKDEDPKRYQLLGIPEIAGAVTANFDEPTGLPVPPDEDQGSSSSCTAQAFAYYFWQWTGIQLSRKSLYSEYFLPGGGGYLIDPFRMVLNGAKPGGRADGKGAYTREDFLDPQPQTEQNMTIAVNLPDKTRRLFKLRYWYVPYNDINQVAAAIKSWKGCVIGVYGNHQDWADGEHPKVPNANNRTWAHALYLMDVGKDRGQDAVIAKSSWCNWIKKHYIIKDYFTSGNVFSPIVMEVQELDMDTPEPVYVINFRGTLGLVKIVDGRQFVGELVANAEEAALVEKLYGRKLIIGTNPDGSPIFAPADIFVP